MWFRKRKKKEVCFHEWKLSDYRTYVDISFESCHVYEITCLKCQKSREIDEYEYNKMKLLGLIK